jgi:hypothetical protein
LSFRRKPESSIFRTFWIPAFAGVTLFDRFEIGSTDCYLSDMQIGFAFSTANNPNLFDRIIIKGFVLFCLVILKEQLV